jgi:hypothetical protein
VQHIAEFASAIRAQVTLLGVLYVGARRLRIPGDEWGKPSEGVDIVAQ